MIGAGILVEARLDPILPGVTDDQESLERLCAALAEIGVRTIAVSVLFLRPAVVGSLRRHVEDKQLVGQLLSVFASSESMSIHAGNSRVRALSAAVRLEIMDRLKSIAPLRIECARLRLQEPGHCQRFLPHFGSLAARGR